MKIKLSFLCFLLLNIVFNFLNGKYIPIAFFTYLLFLLLSFKKINFSKKNILLFIFLFIFYFLILHFFLNIFKINFILKNVLVSFVIVFLNYFLSDLDFVKSLFSFIKEKFVSINDLWDKNVKKTCFFKVLPDNIIIFFLFIFSLFTFFSFYNDEVDDYFTVFTQPNFDMSVPVLSKTKIDVSFVNVSEKFSSMCIRFATYGRVNNSKLSFVIKDNDKVFYKKTFNTKYLSDYGNKCFDFKSISIKKLKNYDIYLIPDYRVNKDNSVGIFKEKKTGNVSFNLANKQSIQLNFIKCLLFIYGFLVFFVINYLINTKKLSFSLFYLFLLMYYIPILFIFPALNIPDETHHFYRAYGNSQILSNDFKFNSFDNDNISVPSNISCLNYSKPQIANRIYDLDTIKNCLKQKDNKVIYNSSHGTSPLLGYIPQALGIKIADIISNSPLFIFYFGRLFSFAISFLICYFAIKNTPKYKSLFLFVATMFMFVQQMISYSYDSILNSISLLYISLLLKIMYGDKKVKIKDFIIPTLCLSLILNVKAVYFPLVVFMFLIPKDKFEKNKYLYIFTSVFLSIFSLKLFSYLISLTLKGNVSSIINNDSSKQLSYLLHHPLFIFAVAFNTIKFHSVFYIRGLIGYFGWFAFKINDLYFIVYLLFALYVIFSEKSSFSKKSRLIIFIFAFVSFVAIFGAMYLLWSDYKSKLVFGVQGRYFIPLIIPFMISLVPSKRFFTRNDNIIFSVINVLLLQFILILTVWYF